MLFNRYREISERCLELGEKIDLLTHKEMEEFRQLLEEQAWLSKTITRHVKDVLEEVREGLEYIKNWVDEEMEKVEKASGDHGSPTDILDLEEIMQEATSIRDRARDLMLNKKEGSRAKSDEDKKNRQLQESAKIRIDLSGDDKSGEKVAGDGSEIKPAIKPETGNNYEEVAATAAKESSKKVSATAPALPNINLTGNSRDVDLKLSKNIINEDTITLLESKLSSYPIPKPDVQNVNEKKKNIVGGSSQSNDTKSKKRKKSRKKKN